MFYRLYRFESGRIGQAADIVCENDVEARRVAEKIYDGRAMELWQGTRKVSGWPEISRPDLPAASAALSATVLGSTRMPGRALEDTALGG